MSWLSLWKNIPHYLNLVVGVLLGILLKQLMDIHLFKKFAIVMKPDSSETAIKIHSWLSSVQITSLQPINLRQILMFFSHLHFSLPNGSLSGWQKCLMHFLYQMDVTCQASLILLHLIFVRGTENYYKS